MNVQTYIQERKQKFRELQNAGLEEKAIILNERKRKEFEDRQLRIAQQIEQEERQRQAQLQATEQEQHPGDNWKRILTPLSRIKIK